MGFWSVARQGPLVHVEDGGDVVRGRERPLDARAAAPSHLVGRRRVLDERTDCLRPTAAVAWVAQIPLHPVCDDLRRPADCRRHHRNFERHCLDHSPAERLLTRRQQERVERRHQLRHVLALANEGDPVGQSCARDHVTQVRDVGLVVETGGARHEHGGTDQQQVCVEPFGAKQVGSSAMPFKRNPVMAERIGSLARLLPGYADVAWQNAATNMLERTLDDSANRRTILPEAFLCTDEILSLARRIVEGLRLDERRIATNLRAFGPFAGSEAVLMEAVKAGGDRQVLHEALRDAAMSAHQSVAQGDANPLAHILVDDEPLTALLDPAEIRALLDPTDHIGDAPERARRLAARIEGLAPFPAPRVFPEHSS